MISAFETGGQCQLPLQCLRDKETDRVKNTDLTFSAAISAREKGNQMAAGPESAL